MKTTTSLFVFAIILFCKCIGGGETLSAEAESLIRSWAPLVWLHSEELFYPSSVDFFLPEMTVQDDQGFIIQEFANAENLIGGENTSALHMQTRQPLDCPTCYNINMFFGQPITKGNVPVYTKYREYADVNNTLDVYYLTFYPYNRGKDACVGVPVGGNCAGFIDTFGNHVGDWEHVTVRFQNLKPIQIYISVHSFGAHYAWNETAGNFYFVDGEPVRSLDDNHGNKETRYTPDYPLLVELFNGTHPIVYSANGSHGLWASEGVFTYFPVLPLQDFTDAGEAWQTWDNLILIPWQARPYNFTGNFTFINFLGDWGNSPEGCGLETVTGECELSGGPSGPGGKGDDDFPYPSLMKLWS